MVSACLEFDPRSVPVIRTVGACFLPMSQTALQPKKLLAERRAGPDRRATEGPPPGRRERRRGIEARRPEVSELQLSSAEWAALNAAVMPSAPKLPPA